MFTIVFAAAALAVLPMHTSEAAISGETFSRSLAVQLGQRLDSDLGTNAAGWYYDNGKLVFNVLTEDAATYVKAKGGVARIVKNSTAKLKSATTTLNETATVPGSAWFIDPKTNQVVVFADSTVTGDKWTTLTKATNTLGAGVVTVERIAGEFGSHSTHDVSINGGDDIYGEGGVQCTLGFAVRALPGDVPGFMTAGHCAQASHIWNADPNGLLPLGEVESAVFGGSADYALVVSDSSSVQTESSIDLKNGGSRTIITAGEVTVGMEVEGSGAISGYRSGYVTGVDVTVTYTNSVTGGVVTLTGMISTDLCGQQGDSGGPLFAGTTGLGLQSGGNGDCAGGGVTFFQPLTKALKAVRAEIV